jgi:hypothetical protein
MMRIEARPAAVPAGTMKFTWLGDAYSIVPGRATPRVSITTALVPDACDCDEVAGLLSIAVAMASGERVP